MNNKYKRKLNTNFCYEENNISLKDILEKCYRQEIRKKKILTGGVVDVLQKSKIDANMQA